MRDGCSLVPGEPVTALRLGAGLPSLSPGRLVPPQEPGFQRTPLETRAVDLATLAEDAGAVTDLAVTLGVILRTAQMPYSGCRWVHRNIRSR
jgi:hypothetical protein